MRVNCFQKLFYLSVRRFISIHPHRQRHVQIDAHMHTETRILADIGT